MNSIITRYIQLGIVSVLLISKATPNNINKWEVDSIFELSLNLQYSHRDSAVCNLQFCLDYYEKTNDTTRIIAVKKLLVKAYSGKGQYLDAYDMVWSTLHLFNNNKFIEEKVGVYTSLASLYIIFQQYENATKYINSAIELANSHISFPDNKAKTLVQLYDLKAWLVTEETKDYKQALQLLDTARFYIKETNDMHFGLLYNNLHLASLFIKMEHFQEASRILEEIEKDFKEQDNPINSLLFYHFGNLYYEQGDHDRAIRYFEFAITAIEKFQNHLDNEVEILNKLAQCHAQKNNHKIAFKYLTSAKMLGDSLFGSHSRQNKVLFEIKNKYEAEIQENEQEIRTQRIKLLEHEKELWLLRTIIYSAFFILIIVAVFTFFRIQARKQKAKQTLLLKEQALEREKQTEILEIKNKELVSSALKLIERDQVMDDIKKKLEEIKASSHNREIFNQIKNSIHTNKNKNWEEFELYYSALNKSFISRLIQNHPKLTPTDVKICAFIKMGFSSKAMAQVMGIGHEGINTTRSRLRKKMGIDRSINLFDYLQKLDTQYL